MTIDRRMLVEALLRLEAAAADVDALLQGVDDALLNDLINGFGPMAPVQCRHRTGRQRDWLEWLEQAGRNYEARPQAHPPGEAIADLLLEWARR